jgi:hypothetical protein
LRRVAPVVCGLLAIGCSALGLADGLEPERGCRACEELDEISAPPECMSWQCSDPDAPAEGVCVLDLIDADADGAPLAACAIDERLADCDDEDPARAPGATERCGAAGEERVDEDCDGTIDEGCE